MMTNLHSLLESMAVLKASDLYLNPGAPPMFKVNGELRWVKETPLEENEVEQLVLESLDQEQIEKFQLNLEVDLSLQIKNGGRFRLNVYRQKGQVALVARHIKNIIPTIEELHLPPVLKELIMAEQGLLLVVGATGVGKSSTVAAMVDYRNQNRQGHILTIEDPIEYIHYHAQSLVSQREIGVDTESYADALKFALREAPDVIVIGEIRDEETAKHALRLAETGHLCVATLHATSANLAVDRLVNFFPPDAHHRIYQDVASHLLAVVAQRLAKGIERKTMPVIELLYNNMHMAEIIRKGSTAELKELMRKDQNSSSQTFDDALYQLVAEGAITQEEATRLADSEVDVQLRLRMEQKQKRNQDNAKVKRWLDNTANWSEYRSVAVEPQPNAGAGEAQMAEQIKGCLTTQGYKITNINPDLVLRSEFAVRARNGTQLEGVYDLSKDVASLPTNETVMQLTLSEAATSRNIWRVQAAQVETGESNSLVFQALLPGLLADIPSVALSKERSI
ncbi:PilT/PilU family type 4a pilus ATPase [Aurantivibrio plasticivorans]